MKLLDSPSEPVLCGAANALFNLSIAVENADSLIGLGALPKVIGHLGHAAATVRAAMVGVLMNCCATSELCRVELSTLGLLGVLLPLL